jgi:uncharacterized protein
VAELPTRLRAALTTAMKARDTAAVTAVRAALAAIDNAGAVAPPGDARPLVDGPIAGAVSGLGAAEATRRDLSDDDIATLVWAEVSDREEAAAGYEQAGHDEHAQRLRQEAAALRAVLAPPLDDRPRRT